MCRCTTGWLNIGRCHLFILCNFQIVMELLKEGHRFSRTFPAMSSSSIRMVHVYNIQYLLAVCFTVQLHPRMWCIYVVNTKCSCFNNVIVLTSFCSREENRTSGLTTGRLHAATGDVCMYV